MALNLPAEALARLQAEALRRRITVDQLVADLANSLPINDALETFIGSGSSGRGDLASAIARFVRSSSRLPQLATCDPPRN